MSTPPQICYKRHRFPPEVIDHAFWLYIRFNLSLREVEEAITAFVDHYNHHRYHESLQILTLSHVYLGSGQTILN